MSDRTHWIFRVSCGCPFGVLDTTVAKTRSKAWREFYDTAKERNAAVDRGVTVDEVDHDTYATDVMPFIRGINACPHGESL